MDLVVLHEDFRDLGPREFGWWRDTLAQHFTESCTRQKQVIVRRMVVGLTHHDHAIQFPGPRRMVGTENLDLQRVGRNPFEDILRIESAVIVADTGVIATDDQVCR